jgi:hypothetical protein
MRCSPFSCCVTQRRRTTARVLLPRVPTTSSTPFDSPPRQCRAPRTRSLLLSRHPILSPFSLTVPRCSLRVSSLYRLLAFSFSPNPKVPINPGAYVGITRPASVTTSFGMQPCRMCMLVRRDVRRCARSAHRPGAHGRFLYSSLVLHLPSLPSPLLFPASCFARSLCRRTPTYPSPLVLPPRRALSSAPFHSSSHPLAGNPPRKPPIRSIDSGGCPSALAWARPCSTSPALRAGCTHSAGNARAPSLPYTLVALPRPRPSSLAPSAHTLLSRPLSLPASCPLLSPTRPHTPHPTRRYALEPSLLSPRFLSAPSITYLHLRLQLDSLPEPYPPTYLHKRR